MRTLFTIGITLAISTVAMAQERVTVPARNSSRPRLVEVSLLNGSINVKTHSGREVIVEATSTGPGGRHRERGPQELDGLKRLDLPGNSGLEVEENDNVIRVNTHPSRNGDVTLTVPVDTSLKLHSNGGDINVDGVHGEIDANDLNGRVTLANVSGTVVAHSLNGAIKVTLDRVDPAKPLSFSTLNGSIDVTLPPDIKANLKLKADNGDVFSDFDIKMNATQPSPITDRDGSNGRYKVHFDRTVLGTINGGGVEMSFNTFNGRISIRKKK